MKNIRLLALLCAALSTSAHAQFADLLKNAVSHATANAVASAAGQAAGAATTNALGSATQKRESQPQYPPQPVVQPMATRTAMTEPAPAAAARPGCPRRSGAPMPPLGARPGNFPEVLWPQEPACGAYRFSDLKFDAAKERARAFVEASAVPCGDCEGGKSYDAWARHHLKGGDYDNRFNQMMLALKPGESFTWQGARYSGRIELAGEHPIGEYPCKQFHWTLRDKANRIAAEREGLYCEWRGDYSASAKWQEVL